MKNKFNLKNYIDDECECEDEDKEIKSSKEIKSVFENELKENEDLIDEKSSNINKEKNKKNNRTLYIQNKIEEDEKDINKMIEINNKSIGTNKRFINVKEVNKNNLKDVCINSQQLTKDASNHSEGSKLFNKNDNGILHIGFKKKNNINTVEETTNENNNTETIDTNTNTKRSLVNETMDDLLKSNERKVKKKINEITTDYNKILEDRMKEDEIILKNVIKLNTTNKKENESDINLNYEEEGKKKPKHYLNYAAAKKTTSFLNSLNSNNQNNTNNEVKNNSRTFAMEIKSNMIKRVSKHRHFFLNKDKVKDINTIRKEKINKIFDHKNDDI